MEVQMQEAQVVAQMMIKGKRTKRQRLPSPLRLALPSSTSSSAGGGRTSTDNSGGFDLSTLSPTTSAEFRDSSTEEDEDMANCLILLAQGHTRKLASEPPMAAAPASHHNHNNNDNKTEPCLYQCKTCNRCFPSFQALGGHRASHKKPKANANTEDQKHAAAVKATFVNHEDDVDHYVDPTTSTALSLQISNRALYNHTSAKSKVHECSICGAEFSSGQALGGHMRRHRTIAVDTSTSTTAGNGVRGSPESQEAKKPRNMLKLDLNLPAPEDDHRGSESKFPFQSKEKVLVFSASSLVDCHY